MRLHVKQNKTFAQCFCKLVSIIFIDLKLGSCWQ